MARSDRGAAWVADVGGAARAATATTGASGWLASATSGAEAASRGTPPSEAGRRGGRIAVTGMPTGRDGACVSLLALAVSPDGSEREFPNRKSNGELQAAAGASDAATIAAKAMRSPRLLRVGRPCLVMVGRALAGRCGEFTTGCPCLACR